MSNLLHDHDHDRGLEFDLSTLIERRQPLNLAAGPVMVCWPDGLLA